MSAHHLAIRQSLDEIVASYRPILSRNCFETDIILVIRTPRTRLGKFWAEICFTIWSREGTTVPVGCRCRQILKKVFLQPKRAPYDFEDKAGNDSPCGFSRTHFSRPTVHRRRFKEVLMRPALYGWMIGEGFSGEFRHHFHSHVVEEADREWWECAWIQNIVRIGVFGHDRWGDGVRAVWCTLLMASVCGNCWSLMLIRPSENLFSNDTLDHNLRCVNFLLYKFFAKAFFVQVELAFSSYQG